MRSISSLGLVPAVIVAMSLAACVSTRTHQSAGEYLDDASITTRVKANLIGDEQVKARQVEVETFRGVVQLNGFVDSLAARDRATTVTRSVAGVEDVHNNLVVQTGQRSVGTVVDDATITAKVKTALIGNTETKATQINVSTREGVVQLSGFVNDTNARYMAESLASDVTGVLHVDNALEIRQLNP